MTLAKYNAAGERMLNESGYAPQGVVVAVNIGATGQSLLATDGAIRLQLTNVEYDPYGYWSTSLQRFTPKIPGYYRISGGMGLASGGADQSYQIVFIYKNGVEWRRNAVLQSGATNGAFGPEVNSSVYLNGTTDYVELWGQPQSNTTTSTGKNVFFTAELVASSVGVAPEPWTTATYQNGWTTQPGRLAAAFFKDPHGMVHLRGSLNAQSATALPAFTLPAGYRPAGEMDYPFSYFPVATSTMVVGQLNVLADGTVRPVIAANTGSGTFSTDIRWGDIGVAHFRAEQ
jgi:hypothetical protein